MKKRKLAGSLVLKKRAGVHQTPDKKVRMLFISKKGMRTAFLQVRNSFKIVADRTALPLHQTFFNPVWGKMDLLKIDIKYFKLGH